MEKLKELKFISSIILFLMLGFFVFYSGFLSFFSLLIPLYILFKHGNLCFYLNIIITYLLVLVFGTMPSNYIYLLLVVFISIIIKYFFKTKASYKDNILKTLYAVFSSYLILLILFLTYEKQSLLNILREQIGYTVVFLEQNYFDLYSQIIIQFASKDALIDNLAVSLPAVFAVLISLYVIINVYLATNLTNKNYLSIKKLIFYRVSYKLLWPAIISGALFVYSTSSYNNALYLKMFALCVFYSFLLVYAFQGMGVLIYYLSIFLKKFIFLQTFILVFMLISASSFIALLGFFDVFFDFRKKIFKGGSL